MYEFIYNGEFEKRVDKFIADNLDYSRSFLAHLFEKDEVLVNGKACKKSYKTGKGDRVVVQNLEKYTTSKALEEAPELDLEVKLEKSDYLVVYKPRGVLAHPNSVWHVEKPSVSGALYHMYGKLPSMGSFLRGGLVHRLDKQTCGLMIVAKTQKGLEYFQDLFKRKSCQDTIKAKEQIKLSKYYKAQSVLTKKGQTFLKKYDCPFYIDKIVKTKSDFVQNYKNGITKVLDYEISQDMIEMDIEILTGRTHQIRYHLSSEGLAVIGDQLYGSGSGNDKLHLKAYKLNFQDMYGENQSVVV